MSKFQVQLAKLAFTAEQLRSLPPHKRAFITALEIALNDLHFFQFIDIQALNSYSDDDVARHYASIRHLICVRNISSRIYELAELFEAFHKILERKNDICGIFDEFYIGLAPSIKSHKFYEIMDWIRNKVNNHYAQQDFRKVFDGYNADYEFIIYIHEMDGNFVSMFAEEIAFFGAMNPRALNFSDAREFQKWLNELAHNFTKFRNNFLISIVKEYFPTQTLRHVTANVDESAVKNIHQAALPLFLTRD
ncbi:MAG: hypothetical protein M3178_06165 [Pseudomonadota bacterium]|nr:hypothetical protein [Pseudomonadota bacterium]